MIKKQNGFTFIELLITMVIFVLVIAAASNMFVGLLTQFKQQSKIVETNIEGNIGLELMRFDIEQAGYGLPWNLNGANYNEAVNYNDAPGDIPRAFVVGDNAGLNTSDVLVIKAVNVATNDAARKWTYISNRGALPNYRKSAWSTIGNEDLLLTDHVIVLNPILQNNQRILLNNGAANFSIQLNSNTFSFNGAASSNNFEPLTDSFNTFVAYGIKTNEGGVAPRMPFNRVDYYISNPGDSMPQKCSPGTGVLYKATLNHSNGSFTELPLVDCVADMQVVFRRDQNGDGTAEISDQNLTGLTAQTIREQVMEVRVYIVAHEGQRDPTYTYTNPDAAIPADEDKIFITDPDVGTFKTFTVPDRNYRWKVYTLVVTPYNLR